MPGRGSYGSTGKWIYDRAHKIIESGEGKTPKRVAYAVATQQAHKVGKSPKGFRTASGVQEAKAKMRRPVREYRKTAAMNYINSTVVDGFFDELEHIEKNAIGLKALALGGGLLAAGIGGAAKALPSAVAKAARKPSIMQVAKKAIKDGSAPLIGMKAARNPEVAKALRF